VWHGWLGRDGKGNERDAERGEKHAGPLQAKMSELAQSKPRPTEPGSAYHKMQLHG
jgi:hypothetical protein